MNPGEVIVGKFRICQKEYAGKMWIYAGEGEGMEVCEEELEKAIKEFYATHF